VEQGVPPWGEDVTAEEEGMCIYMTPFLLTGRKFQA
jgi:hypothetical protein